MVYRKGMGRGKGKGYYNIINKDSSIHSMSAKGIKQPQRLNVHPTKEDLARHKWEHYLMHMENFKDTDGDKAPDIIDCDPADPNEQGVKDVWKSFRKNLKAYFNAYQKSEEYKNLPKKEKKIIDDLEKDIGYINSKYTVEHFINKHKNVVVPSGLLIMSSTGLPVVGQSVIGAIQGLALQKEVFNDYDNWEKARKKWKNKLQKQLPDVGEREISRLAGREAIKEIYSDSDIKPIKMEQKKIKTQPMEETNKIFEVN